MKRIDGDWLAEREFLAEAEQYRNLWWGNLLLSLNKVVRLIRDGNLGQSSFVRMADWESLGRVIAKSEENGNLWEKFVRNLEIQQNNFLIKGDLIVEGIGLWMSNSGNHGKLISTRELYDQLTKLLFPEKKSFPRDWANSCSGFGKRLLNLVPALEYLYKVYSTDDRRMGTKFYQFEPLEPEHPQKGKNENL